MRSKIVVASIFGNFGSNVIKLQQKSRKVATNFLFNIAEIWESEVSRAKNKVAFIKLLYDVLFIPVKSSF